MENDRNEVSDLSQHPIPNPNPDRAKEGVCVNGYEEHVPTKLKLGLSTKQDSCYISKFQQCFLSSLTVLFYFFFGGGRGWSGQRGLVKRAGPTAFGDKDLVRSPILRITNTFFCVSVNNEDVCGILVSVIWYQPFA